MRFEFRAGTEPGKRFGVRPPNLIGRNTPTEFRRWETVPSFVPSGRFSSLAAIQIKVGHRRALTGPFGACEASDTGNGPAVAARPALELLPAGDVEQTVPGRGKHGLRILRSRRPVAVFWLHPTGSDPNVRGDSNEAHLTLHGHCSGFRRQRVRSNHAGAVRSGRPNRAQRTSNTRSRTGNSAPCQQRRSETRRQQLHRGAGPLLVGGCRLQPT